MAPFRADWRLKRSFYIFKCWRVKRKFTLYFLRAPAGLLSEQGETGGADPNTGGREGRKLAFGPNDWNRGGVDDDW